MNKSSYFRLLLLLFAFGCTNSQGNKGDKEEKQTNQTPNILFILVDDMSWGALSSYGNRYMETPNLDRLAAQGARFTDAYVTPQYTPTRATLLTGQYTALNRMFHVVGGYQYPYAYMTEPTYLQNLERETFTLAEALKEQGYTTAHLGKWHLHTWDYDGYYTKLWDTAKVHYGFDYVDPQEYPGHNHLRYHQTGDKGVDFLTDQAIAFMDKNQGQPWFINLWHHTVHGPVVAPDSLVDKYVKLGYPRKDEDYEKIHYSTDATYLAALEHMDNSIGRLMSKLEELGSAGNTAVVFLTDNGGEDRKFENFPLKHGKGSPYEGGIRVPMIVRWPTKIPSNIINEPVHAVDIYPTFLAMAGGNPPEEYPLEGENLLPLLTGQADSLKRDAIYFYQPLYDWQWGATPSAAIREGDFKLISFFGDYVNVEEGEKT